MPRGSEKYYVFSHETSNDIDQVEEFDTEKAMLDRVAALIRCGYGVDVYYGYKVELEAVQTVTEFRVKR